MSELSVLGAGMDGLVGGAADVAGTVDGGEDVVAPTVVGGVVEEGGGPADLLVAGDSGRSPSGAAVVPPGSIVSGVAGSSTVEDVVGAADVVAGSDPEQAPTASAITEKIAMKPKRRMALTAPGNDTTDGNPVSAQRAPTRGL